MYRLIVALRYLSATQMVIYWKSTVSWRQCIGLSGITIAILSLRVYSNEDLVSLYRSRNDHAPYYAYISEYLFAIVIWASAFLCMVIYSICDFATLPAWLSVTFDYFYLIILVFNIFCTVDLLIKNIHRLTIKTKIDAENK